MRRGGKAPILTVLEKPMAPDDTTPHGREIMHELPERAKIPQPKPGSENDEPLHGTPGAGDLADDQADPVKERGPGSNDAGKSLKKQRG